MSNLLFNIDTLIGVNSPMSVFVNSPMGVFDNAPMGVVDNSPMGVVDNSPMDVFDNAPMDVFDNAPVGVFDSGVGGLSVLREIRRHLPSENLIYVADSGHAPYGNRTAQFIEERATAITKFLISANVKIMVVACNTITVVAIDRLRSWCPVPIVAIEPAIKPAASTTKSGVIGVLATTQTIASSSVSRLCAMYGNNVKVLLQPCPGLVEKVEQAELTTKSTRLLVRNYIVPLLDKGADTIVLGCTHYPFLGQMIHEVAGPNVAIIDPAAPVARELSRQLTIHQISAKPNNCGREEFFASGHLLHVQLVTSTLWGEQIEVHHLPKYRKPVNC